MLSGDRDDERKTARDEQETERCRPAARRQHTWSRAIESAPQDLPTCVYGYVSNYNDDDDDDDDDDLG